MALDDGSTVVLASPAARGVARFVDSLVHLGLGVGGLMLVFVATFCVWCSAHETDGGLLAAGLALWAVWALYEPVTTAWLGRTLGKMACGIEVVCVADGAKPGFGRALGRWAVPVGVGAVFGVAGEVVAVATQSGAVGLAIIFVGWVLVYVLSFRDKERRRGWHDKAAGTIVITSQPAG